MRLEIDGADLLAAGVPEGPAIGARAPGGARGQARRRARRDASSELAEALRAATDSLRGRCQPQPNALRWDGAPGHYEVYYLTLTDPASGVGLWIRYTMVAPLAETGRAARARCGS